MATLPSFVVSPLYKINDNLNTYVSWQYGEKAGIAQFVNGVSSLARAEKSASYEWGVKSVLLNRKLLAQRRCVPDQHHGLSAGGARARRLHHDAQQRRHQRTTPRPPATSRGCG